MSNSEIDIDLKDPEVEKAALKIQAQFKGFKSHKLPSVQKPVHWKQSKAKWIKLSIAKFEPRSPAKQLTDKDKEKTADSESLPPT